MKKNEISPKQLLILGLALFFGARALEEVGLPIVSGAIGTLGFLLIAFSIAGFLRKNKRK